MASLRDAHVHRLTNPLKAGRDCPNPPFLQRLKRRRDATIAAQKREPRVATTPGLALQRRNVSFRGLAPCRVLRVGLDAVLGDV